MDHSSNIIITAKQQQQQQQQHHPRPSWLRKRPLSRKPNNGRVNVQFIEEEEEENEVIFSRRLRNDDPEEKRHYRGGYAFGQQSADDTIHITATTTTTTTGHNNTIGSIQVAHNCLLIPVAIAIWWYWFKRAARRVTKRLILGPAAAARGCTSARCNDDNVKEDDNDGDEEIATYAGEDDDDDDDNILESQAAAAASATNFDHFQDWNDVMNHNAQDHSVHFVKWFQDSAPLKQRKSPSSSSFSSPSLAVRRRLKGVAKRAMVFRQHPLTETSKVAAAAAAATTDLSSSRQTPFISRIEKNATHPEQGAAAAAQPPPQKGPPSARQHNFISHFTSTSASFDDALSTATSTFAWECIQDTTIGVEILVTLHEANSSSSRCSSTNPSIEAKMTDGDDGIDSDSSSIHMNPLV